ncbi:MAG: CPBP family intramembrane glutamic endopeptidase [Acidobacteriota bacterium]
MTRARSTVRWLVPVVWAFGMFAARRFDPWPAIAIPALIMVAAVLITDRIAMGSLFRPSIRSLSLALAAAAAMLGVTYLLFPFVTRSIPSVREQTEAIYSQFLAGRPLAAIVAFVLPIILAEEILWRGAFQEAVRRRSRGGSALISAAVYAAAHAPLGSALLVAVAFICGLYWSILRERSSSLLPSLIAHVAWDLALILVPLIPSSAPVH